MPKVVRGTLFRFVSPDGGSTEIKIYRLKEGDLFLYKKPRMKKWRTAYAASGPVRRIENRDSSPGRILKPTEKHDGNWNWQIMQWPVDATAKYWRDRATDLENQAHQALLAMKGPSG